MTVSTSVQRVRGSKGKFRPLCSFRTLLAFDAAFAKLLWLLVIKDFADDARYFL